MKCESCGGNLSLEDVVCPHCDALNEHAVQHIRDMNKYRREFQGTQKEVQEVARNHSGIMVRVVAVCILIVLIVVGFILNKELYSIHGDMIERKAIKNAEQNMEMLDRYIEEGDYSAFNVFFSYTGVNTYSGPYEKYNRLRSATMHYANIYGSIMRLKKVDEYGTRETILKSIGDDMSYFYRFFQKDDFYYVEESDWQYPYICDIEDRIKALLITYMGVTREDVQNFREMTTAERNLVIEESCLDEE